MGILTTNTKSGLASALGSRTGAQEIEYLLYGNELALDGAKGDGVADDTTAIQSALTRARTSENKTVIIPAGRFYRITSGIAVPVGVNFICEGTLVYDNTDNTVAVTVGESGEVNGHVKLRIAIKRATISNWSSESSIGVRLINVYNSEIDIARAEGFTIGCQFAGHLACAYNYGIRLGYLYDNKVGLDLRTFHADGYTNENSFIGGRFSHTNSNNNGLARYGVRFSKESGAYANHNNNTFYSPTFELKVANAGANEALPILMEVDGNHNKFLGFRSEFNGGPHYRAVAGSEARLNVIEPLYSQLGTAHSITSAMTWEGNRKSDVFSDPETELITRVASEWNSGDLVTKATQRTTGGFERTHTVGIHWETSSGGGAAALVPAIRLTNDGDYLTPVSSGTSACIIVDTTKNKRFVVKKQVNASAPGRFAIRCYDGHPLDGGAIITSGSQDLVRGSSSGDEATWVSGEFGGSYRRGSDSDTDWFFSVADSVKYICVINRLSAIGSFSVGTPDQFPLRCFPLHGVNDGNRYCDGVPDTGTYKTGTFVLNSAKTSSMSSPFGWYCTAAGTPGTWIPLHASTILTGSKTHDFASIADGDSESTTVTVTGAVAGNRAIAALTTAIPDKHVLSAYVTATDTVTVTLSNIGGTPTNHASGTLSVQVFQ